MSREPVDTSAEPFVPHGAPLDQVREASLGCLGCHLWQCGRQTVFGEGPVTARIMLIGEQPGDQEDKAGKPFVGPAGRVLDQALELAGIDRADVYLTNAVKHFKWVAKGNRRLHQKPNRGEIRACYPWLQEELAQVDPALVVCLGATAAQAMLGFDFKVTEGRGKVIEVGTLQVLATIHPSAVLRQRSGESRDEMMRLLVHDLQLATTQVKRGPYML